MVRLRYARASELRLPTPGLRISARSVSFYNVSYAENALLADSARPEEGRITPGGMTIRIAKKSQLLLALGETISPVRSYWDRLLNYPVRHLGRHVDNLSRLTIAPVMLLVVSVLAGLYILGQRGAILILFDRHYVRRTDLRDSLARSNSSVTQHRSHRSLQ